MVLYRGKRRVTTNNTTTDFLDIVVVAARISDFIDTSSVILITHDH